jgi:S-adenosylmethionine:tRNA ribosyltransferase-isomerase
MGRSGENGRFRDFFASFCAHSLLPRMVRIEAILLARENENRWRARILPAEIVQVGDRLRFGDTSGSPACFLAFLDADIIEGNGDNALLSFHFTGTALEEALDRLGDTPSDDETQSA